MEKRKLGKSGLEIAPLMFGGNVFGWTADEAMSFKLLDCVRRRRLQCHRHGGRLFEVGAGQQGRRIRDHHRQVAQGARRPRQGRHRHQGRQWRWAPDKKGLAKAYILRAVEDSLKRLQTDYIDLYQSHIDDAATPLRGDAVGLCAADRRRARCAPSALQLHRAAAGRGPRDQCAKTAAALREPAAALQPVRARRLREPSSNRCA